MVRKVLIYLYQMHLNLHCHLEHKREPFFEYEGVPLCDLKVGLRGFFVIEMGSGYQQMSVMDETDLGIYTQMFDDIDKFGLEHIEYEDFTYQYHFRDWRLKNLLKDED